MKVLGGGEVGEVGTARHPLTAARKGEWRAPTSPPLTTMLPTSPHCSLGGGRGRPAGTAGAGACRYAPRLPPSTPLGREQCVRRDQQPLPSPLVAPWCGGGVAKRGATRPASGASLPPPQGATRRSERSDASSVSSSYPLASSWVGMGKHGVSGRVAWGRRPGRSPYTPLTPIRFPMPPMAREAPCHSID